MIDKLFDRASLTNSPPSFLAESAAQGYSGGVNNSFNSGSFSTGGSPMNLIIMAAVVAMAFYVFRKK